jgi:hypothetical protein
MNRMSRALPLLLPLLALACAAPSGDGVQREPLAVIESERMRWELPEDWLWIEPASFERLATEAFPDGTVTPIHHDSLRRLYEGLDLGPRDAVRAAVLLGRSRNKRAGELLLRRLEKRVRGADRAADAGDVVAAAALATFPRRGRYLGRLVALAVGDTAHPDLEVRVQCAATAVDLGDDAPLPFLLQVLRIDTAAGLDDERDFEVSPTTAWARWTASDALARRAGCPNPYRVDASLADRDAATRALEAALPAPAPAAE